MPLSNPDDKLLLIRCPSCGQRFKVEDALRGRTVECGACEHRFRINDETIVRGKKFYPGERKDTKLNRFQRVPLALSPEVVGILPMSYGEVPDFTAFEPASPQRVVAGVVGAVFMVFMALLLMFGASRGGALDGMPMEHRLLMAGFAGLLGIILLVYANPRARGKALVVGGLLSAGLLALPFFFTVGSEILTVTVHPSSSAPVKKIAPTTAESVAMMDLRNLIGTAPLAAEIDRLAQEGGHKQAVGLWLRGLHEQNRFLVRDYILRVTGADLQSHYYARGGGDFLMVVTGIQMSLDEVAKLATVLGTLENVYPQIAVAEIRINNESFAGGSIEKLADKGQAEFYDLNKRELESIDLERVERAVQRLAEAEPKIYRSDITTKFISLLRAPGVTFKGAICRALAVWSEHPGPAGDAALKEVNDMRTRKVEVPQEMIALIIKEKNVGVLPVLDALWVEKPTSWESLYGDVGAPAEALLLRRFSDTDGMVRHSAVRLLGRVGGAASLPVLEAAVPGANAELKVLLEKSSDAIRRRLAP